MRSYLLILLVLLCACAWSAEPARPATTLRVYHVGNSLTMSLRLDRLHRFFASRGIDYQFGSQLSGGKSLLRQWNYQAEPDQKWVSWEANQPEGERWLPGIQFNDPLPKRFGLYDQALPRFAWDVVALQPFGSSLRDDIEACTSFITLARRKSPQARFLVYGTWPKRLKSGDRLSVDYPAVWTAAYGFAADDADRRAFTGSASRDYYSKLCQQLAERIPDLTSPIGFVPGGEVLYALDQAIRAGSLPGLDALAKRSPKHLPGLAAGGIQAQSGANLLYADPIHLNPIPHDFPTLGVFAISMTMFATLSGQSPVGLLGSIYDLDDTEDAALILAIQQLVWKVVSSEPRVVLGAKP